MPKPRGAVRNRNNFALARGEWNLALSHCYMMALSRLNAQCSRPDAQPSALGIRHCALGIRPADQPSTEMGFPGFHPLVARWFRETLGAPTSAQERGWAAIRDGRHTLIAAPTGSGKTLAAFLTAIDDLVHEGLQAPLPDEVRVVYVSPLKALSADIHKNLAEPRQGIRKLAASSGVEAPRITAAVRTGDTTQSERAAMLRTPPHILVTTPESLYLLLTSARSREMLRTVRTVIVDEIHAVIGGRRGAHLALSLERLQGIVEADVQVRPGDRPVLQRIGLSATQKPIDEVARFLVGNRSADLEDPPRTVEYSASRRGPFRSAAIVDEGHRREIDLAVEIPRSPLDAVMSNEVWQEYYDRLTELISEHKTTLIFVNTRKMAERTARHLSERLGEHAVTAHHGSLSKEIRLDAEHRLKTGTLKALVATASLELGIDIGHVDLVCQIGSPHRIATLLQRVGRSGHTIAGTPKGRLMPVSRDDLIECAALLRSVRMGELDRIVTQDAPLDVLAQQIAAEVATTEYGEDELFAFVRRAWPYRSLSRSDFDAVVGMLADGFATKRGRRAALVHRDEVHAVLRGRRGTRMLALTSGGAIPEVADYRVVVEPDDTFVGTLNEDFAIESNAGDVFQLGNTSWQITQVVAGSVRVRDAHGAPPTIPFWLGEAPARSDELSRAVSDLRKDAETVLSGADLSLSAEESAKAEGPLGEPERLAPHVSLAAWLETESGLCPGGAEQAASYLLDGRAALGVIPTQETLVLERFFDESGGMQLVLHAPFGSRINKAWTLALRKRFCRQFNFELQAAATEDALLLSLGPQHSFPLSDVFRYLHPATTRDILVQALLDAPVFKTRWRWNTTISLAVPRSRGGRKVPPQLQRMQADDLMAAVFPDAAACLENIPGDREVPDHPLVNQTVRDCLDEAMDFDGLVAVLTRIHAGELRCVSRDTPEPSAFAHEILNAKPYAFLDDAPLEERRTQAVQTRMASDRAGSEMRALDADAIERVRDEERPDPRDVDELHDALLTAGFLRDDEITIPATPLTGSGRATRAVVGTGDRGSGIKSTAGPSDPGSRIPDPDSGTVGPRSPIPDPCRIWIAAERLPELLAVHPDALLGPPITAPPSRAAHAWTREAAVVELLRGRLSIVGPTTAPALAESLAITDADANAALLALEGEGAVLRGHFSLAVEALEWCDRRLLSRIHRYTLNRLRAEISPVTPADFMRFLFVWQHVEPSCRLTGIEGLREVLAQLDGTEAPARAWERDVLAARLDRYDPAMLDMLCLTGTVAWARLSSGPTQVVGATPIALFLREHADAWLTLTSGADPSGPPSEPERLAPQVIDYLRTHGASFASELAAACDLNDEQLRAAIADLVAAGAVSSDGFAGLRSIVGASPNHSSARLNRADASGRWFALRAEATDSVREAAIETLAWTLLRRYGVVFRRVLTREAMNVPWRELARVYRRLEARGEIRGGRFVTGMSGEQFALPAAIEPLREVRRSAHDDRLMTIGAADPLNLSGIVTGEDRIRVSASNRLVYRNGVPVAAMEGDLLRVLSQVDPDVAAAAAAAAAGRRVPVISGYVGRL
jgi:ATP-dependent Lhr-like helicase